MLRPLWQTQFGGVPVWPVGQVVPPPQAFVQLPSDAYSPLWSETHWLLEQE